MGTQLPKRCTAPRQFSIHVCSGQMAGWIRIPLGMEVGLGSRDVVLNGDPVSCHYLTESGTASHRYLAHVYYGQTVTHSQLLLSSCQNTFIVCLGSKNGHGYLTTFHITAPLFKYLAPFDSLLIGDQVFLCKHVQCLNIEWYFCKNGVKF